MKTDFRITKSYPFSYSYYFDAPATLNCLFAELCFALFASGLNSFITFSVIQIEIGFEALPLQSKCASVVAF